MAGLADQTYVCADHAAGLCRFTGTVIARDHNQLVLNDERGETLFQNATRPLRNRSTPIPVEPRAESHTPWFRSVGDHDNAVRRWLRSQR